MNLRNRLKALGLKPVIVPLEDPHFEDWMTEVTNLSVEKDPLLPDTVLKHLSETSRDRKRFKDPQLEARRHQKVVDSVNNTKLRLFQRRDSEGELISDSNKWRNIVLFLACLAGLAIIAGVILSSLPDTGDKDAEAVSQETGVVAVAPGSSEPETASAFGVSALNLNGFLDGPEVSEAETAASGPGAIAPSLGAADSPAPQPAPSLNTSSSPAAASTASAAAAAQPSSYLTVSGGARAVAGGGSTFGFAAEASRETFGVAAGETQTTAGSSFRVEAEEAATGSTFSLSGGEEASASAGDLVLASPPAAGLPSAEDALEPGSAPRPSAAPQPSASRPPPPLQAPQAEALPRLEPSAAPGVTAPLALPAQGMQPELERSSMTVAAEGSAGVQAHTAPAASSPVAPTLEPLSEEVGELLAFTRALVENELQPGKRVAARLSTGVVAVEGSSSPVVAETLPQFCTVAATCPKMTFLGNAEMLASNYLQISWHSVLIGEVLMPFEGIALDMSSNTLIRTELTDQAPAAALDLVRSTLGGISRFVNAKVENPTLQVLPDGTVVQESQVPPLETFLLANAADVFAFAGGRTSVVRVAQLPAGTPIQVLSGVSY